MNRNQVRWSQLAHHVGWSYQVDQWLSHPIGVHQWLPNSGWGWQLPVASDRGGQCDFQSPYCCLWTLEYRWAKYCRLKGCDEPSMVPKFHWQLVLVLRQDKGRVESNPCLTNYRTDWSVGEPQPKNRSVHLQQCNLAHSSNRHDIL